MNNQPTESKFNQWKNYQSIQECMLIGLLNSYSEIKIKKPFKKAMVTVPFVAIDKIIFNKTDIINVSEFLNKRCQERMNYEIQIGVSSKTALRRYKTNKFSETNHLLMDLLLDLGYLFNTTIPPHKKNLQAHETIQAIFDREGRCYTRQMINLIGSKINAYFAAYFEFNKDPIILEKNHKQIEEIINDCWNERK